LPDKAGGSESKMKAEKTKSLIGKSFLAAGVLILIIIFAGCSVNGKYKKHKAIPCPCETERRR
jgi:hypothetical protein